MKPPAVYGACANFAGSIAYSASKRLLRGAWAATHLKPPCFLPRIGEFPSLKIQFTLAFQAKETRAAMVRRFTRRNFLNLAAMAAAAPLFEVKALRGVDFVLR